MLAACAPTLDWREVRPDGSALVVLMPCKPEKAERPLELGGIRVPVQQLACRAGDTLWGVTSAELRDPARVGEALAQLRQARARNLQGQEREHAPAAVKGMTPQPQAQRFTVVGRDPDGRDVTEQSLVFAHGTRVFHLAALGGAPSAEALETFFAQLHLGR